MIPDNAMYLVWHKVTEDGVPTEAFIAYFRPHTNYAKLRLPVTWIAPCMDGPFGTIQLT